MQQLIHGRAHRLLLALLAAVGLVVPVAVVATASPAQAQVVFINVVRDGFEGSTTTWRLGAIGNGSAGIEHNSPHPRSGQNNGYLLGRNTVAWGERAVRLPNWTPTMTCDAWIFVQTPGAALLITIYEAGTGRVITSRNHNLGNTGLGYTKVSGPTWQPGAVLHVTYSIRLMNFDSDQKWIRMDDFGVDCSDVVPIFP
jgi:hypothetical protein